MLVIIMGKCDHVHIYGNDVSKTFMCVCGHLSSAKLKVSFFFFQLVVRLTCLKDVPLNSPLLL